MTTHARLRRRAVRRRPLPPCSAADEPAACQRRVRGRSVRPRYQFVIAPHVDIGIVFIFAVASLAVYAIILGGWSANNKYSFLGGLRSSAQIISYEIPMGMSILGVVLHRPAR